ncbi:MAG: XkdF-like putative serine protease domain-containing protein [Prevotella sp.]|nr:XkdF-like putative serine protease domain-containing protein [Prevotella sp.]
MKKKLKRYQVGLNSETLAVSFVTEPAIEETFVALKKDKEDIICLSTNEKHMCYGAVCVPDKEIYRNDASGEYTITFSKESIEKMSQNFMKNYRQGNVTLQHSEDAENIVLVESWIKADMSADKSIALGLNPELPVGTWFAGYKVNDTDTWDRIKNNELRGFSIEAVIEVNELNFDADVAPTDTETVEAPVVETPVAEETPTTEEKPAEEPKSSIEDRLDKIWEVVQTMLPKEEPNEPTGEPQDEPIVEEPITTPTAEEKPAEEPKIDINELNSTIENLKSELEALRQKNELLENEKVTLAEKVNELGRTPSARPVDANAKPNGNDSASNLSSWLDKMQDMLR